MRARKTTVCFWNTCHKMLVEKMELWCVQLSLVQRHSSLYLQAAALRCPFGRSTQVALAGALQGKGSSNWVWDHKLLAENCLLGIPDCNLGFCHFWCCGLLSVSWQRRNHGRFITVLAFIWAKLLHASHLISPLSNLFAYLLSVSVIQWQLILKFHLCSGSRDLPAGHYDPHTIDKKLL